MEIIKVFVGPERKEYHLRKALEHNTPFFAAALQPDGFKESITKDVFLVDAPPDAFDIFARWLYVGELGQIELNSDAGLALYLKVYFLADKFLDTKLMDVTIEAVKVWAQNRLIPAHSFAYVYENLPEGSRMRKEVVRAIAKDIEKFPFPGLFYEVKDYWRDILAEARRNIDFAMDLQIATATMIGKAK